MPVDGLVYVDVTFRALRALNGHIVTGAAEERVEACKTHRLDITAGIVGRYQPITQGKAEGL